jgi:hypothetical protein
LQPVCTDGGADLHHAKALFCFRAEDKPTVATTELLA